MTYLLKSLPEDLDPYECDQVNAALPMTLSSRSLASGRSGATTPEYASGLPKSVVHRIVQAFVLNIFLLSYFLLPYIIVVGKSVASVERKYKVSQTIIGHGVNCFNAAGKQCAKIAEVVLSPNDDKLCVN